MIESVKSLSFDEKSPPNFGECGVRGESVPSAPRLLSLCRVCNNNVLYALTLIA